MTLAPRSSRTAAWGVPLSLAAALLAFTACRAREGERCVCADDCREGFLCVASGRVLADGECSPAVGQDTNPGVCLSEDEAAEEDGGGGPAEPFMDMGSKLDFQPGPLPDPETESATGTTEGSGTTAGTTDATTDATGTSSSSGGTTDGTTDATGSTGSSGGTTDASGSTGSTGSTTVGT